MCFCSRSVSSYNVILGSHDIDNSQEGAVSRKAQAVLRHPSYNSRSFAYDYGIIRLQSPVTFNSKGMTNL